MRPSPEQRSSSSSSSGIGFAGLLAIAFIVLKLTGFLSWSWWWVLAPLWAPAVLVLVVLLVAGVVFILRGSATESKRRRARKRDAATDNDHRPEALHGPVRKWGYRPADVDRMRLHADRADADRLRDDQRRIWGDDT